MSGKREHPRYAVEVAVVVRAGGTVMKGRTTNVSRGGFCATLTAAVPIGATFECELALVLGEDSQSEPLLLAARAAWCTSVDDGFQAGIAFRAMSPEQAQYLDIFMRYLEDARRSADPAKDPDDVFGG